MRLAKGIINSSLPGVKLKRQVQMGIHQTILEAKLTNLYAVNPVLKFDVLPPCKYNHNTVFPNIPCKYRSRPAYGIKRQSTRFYCHPITQPD